MVNADTFNKKYVTFAAKFLTNKNITEAKRQ